MTVYEPSKIRLHYSPYDHFNEYHYYGEMNLDDSKKVDDCLKTILDAMQGNKTDLVELEKDLDLYGIKKQFANSKQEPADVIA